MTTRIEVRARGPLVVEGEIEVVGRDGQVLRPAGPQKVRLCRCGASRSAPFCDSSHNRLADFDTDDESGG